MQSIPAKDILAACDGMLRKQLYVVLTKPTRNLAPIMEVLDEHLQFQIDLERRGIMFGAGPFWTDDLEAFERGSMDEEVFSHLQWIVREGPYVGIWPIVVADLEQDQKSGVELLRQFGTIIFEALHNSAGSASKYRPPELLARYPNFEVSTGAEILRFAVPAA